MNRLISCCFLTLITVMNTSAQSIEQLYQTFKAVPDSTKSKVWWFHGENITTREGITADLEAFKAVGMKGVIYYDMQHGKGAPDALKAMSPEWWEMLKFAAQEAKRIGLTFEINISNGYVAGGPWVTPDLQMQAVNSSEIVIKSGEHYKGSLPKPGRKFFGDIAVLAYPIKKNVQETVKCLPDGFSTKKATTVMLASFPQPFTARSLSYNMVGWGKGPQSIINVPCEPQDEFYGDRFVWQPPIGELEVSDDSITWRKVTTLSSLYKNKSLRPNHTISFPAATGRYFRLNLHDWMPKGNGQPPVSDLSNKELKIYNVELSTIARIDRWEVRAAYFSDYLYKSETPQYGSDEVIEKSQLIDISQYMNDKGELDWTAPKGSDWKVICFGYGPTGGASKHGRPNLMGPEIDKLSAHAAEVHWKNYPQRIIDTLTAIGCRPVGVCMDSHEAGAQNWTHNMPEMFKKKFGYDIRSWLPAIQGYVVGSTKETEQFLQDFRRTIADGINEQHFATIQHLCNREGIQLTAQAMGNGQSICADNLSGKGVVDVPQGEFWTRHHDGSYDTKECSSAAHIYGGNIASCESFTDFAFTDQLGSVKDEIDMETAMQVNELVVCAAVFQPWTDSHPYRTASAENRDYALNTRNTLWPFARGFFDYQARNALMIRSGRPVVDILVYAGDDVPMKLLGNRLPHIPEGYDFDVCTTDAFSKALTLRNGKLVSKSGCEYQLLAIEKHAIVRAETERLIAQWKAAGLPVYDNRTMADDGMKQILYKSGIHPDVTIKSRISATDRVFTTHRKTDNADIYFLANHSKTRIFDDYVTLRTNYSYAEYWDAVTGQRYQIPAEQTADGMKLRLRLRHNEAGFIVTFNAAADSPLFALHSSLSKYNPWAKESVTAINGLWTLTFDRFISGPEKPVTTRTLFDFTTSNDPEIKYFSGLCTYDNTFRLKKKPTGQMLLRIPNLNGTARVLINGQEAGLIWCTPWDIDITSLVKKGNNALRIEVRNTLANRLIGDMHLPEAERKILPYRYLYNKNSRLPSAGIVGDVLLIEK